MRMRYTKEQKLELVKLLHKNNDNIYRAQQEYARLHPGEHIPNKATFKRVGTHLQQFHTLERKKRTVIHNENEELSILLHFQGIVIFINYVYFLL